ncbi:hypothetical protein EI32_4535 [Mycobacterium tuberculosis]|nr:hypothetical protein EI32_4535 [Mycobacterium tuberculosis]
MVAASIVHHSAAPANRGRYHGIWSMTPVVASVVVPSMASYGPIHGAHLLAAVVVGSAGAALCLPLARALRRPTPSAMTTD